MPRKTKDEIEEIEEKPAKKATRGRKSTAEITPAKKTSSKKNSAKKTVNKEITSEEVSDKKTVAKKTATKKSSSKETSVKVVAKKTASNKTSAKENSSKAATKKSSSKENSAKKSSTRNVESTKKKAGTSSKTEKKTSSKKAPSKEKNKKTSKKEINSKSPIEVLEYYDLPYRYNQTVVKILAQTPSTLFVYWDISDEEKEQYIKQYGEYFFNNTKPVLIIHNKTMNYSFEIDINDFANSWYLHVNDSNCDYQVELGRRPINQYVQIPNNYLHVVDSNDYITQNDHILFEKLSHLVYFRNVKTNETIVKNITDLALLQKIGKFDIKKIYEKLYPNGVYDFEKIHLGNPSSH